MLVSLYSIVWRSPDDVAGIGQKLDEESDRIGLGMRVERAHDVTGEAVIGGNVNRRPGIDRRRRVIRRRAHIVGTAATVMTECNGGGAIAASTLLALLALALDASEFRVDINTGVCHEICSPSASNRSSVIAG